jgi:hypothetical protein
MDFKLSEEHLMVQKMVRDFAQKEIAPLIKECDQKQEMAPFTLKRMGELGILGYAFPCAMVDKEWIISRSGLHAKNWKRLTPPCVWFFQFILGCAV